MGHNKYTHRHLHHALSIYEFYALLQMLKGASVFHNRAWKPFICEELLYATSSLDPFVSCFIAATWICRVHRIDVNYDSTL